MADEDTIDLPEIQIESRRVMRPWPRPDQEPKREETATLVVGGRRFEDWESVWLKHKLLDAYAQFRFTAAERDPMPEWWDRLQFKPQDDCEIYLGGMLALTGIILIRQTAYAGKQHGVVLQGVTNTWAAARASIIHKTGIFPGGFVEIAKQVLAPTGVGMKVVGAIDGTPFKPPAKNEPGESIFSFLDRLARDRKVIIGSDRYGNFIFYGEKGAETQETLQEGFNILKMQCVISVVKARSNFETRGQRPTGEDSDEGTPRDRAEQKAVAGGSLKRYSPLLTIMEHPVWTPKEVALRNATEVMWNEGQEIEATITVQGWFTSAGRLWEVGKEVMVKSPMAMLNEALTIETVTFTQDSGGGSITTLLCKNPAALNTTGINFGIGAQPFPTSTPVNPNPTDQKPAG
jgi:prophage tail gpP-like protein